MHSVEGPEDDNFLMRGRETPNISDIRNVDDKILMRNSLNLKKKSKQNFGVISGREIDKMTFWSSNFNISNFSMLYTIKKSIKNI